MRHVHTWLRLPAGAKVKIALLATAVILLMVGFVNAQLDTSHPRTTGTAAQAAPIAPTPAVAVSQVQAGWRQHPTQARQAVDAIEAGCQQSPGSTPSLCRCVASQLERRVTLDEALAGHTSPGAPLTLREVEQAALARCSVSSG